HGARPGGTQAMAGRRSTVGLQATLVCAGLTLPLALVFAAKPAAPLTLIAGARIGVVSVLDAEVTHFHAAAQVKDSYLKTEPVGWSVPAMLTEALRAPLTERGYVPVPLAAGEALTRARESCFLDANLEKPLSKDCAAAFARVAQEGRVQALIVLGPGLNDS